MEKHYFIGEGPEAEKLIAATLERREVATEARRKLMEDYGADGLIKRDWDGGRIIGLGFKKKTDAPFLKGCEKVSDGYTYYPKRNTKAGKELAKRLEDERLTFNASSFIRDALGISRMVFEGRQIFEAAAGVTEDLKKILVVIPGTKEKSPGCTDPFPAVPEWMREVKESEFLAAQGK